MPHGADEEHAHAIDQVAVVPDPALEVLGRVVELAVAAFRLAVVADQGRAEPVFTAPHVELAVEASRQEPRVARRQLTAGRHAGGRLVGGARDRGRGRDLFGRVLTAAVASGGGAPKV